jgi:hypothetical protein
MEIPLELVITLTLTAKVFAFQHAADPAKVDQKKQLLEYYKIKFKAAYQSLW